MAVHTHSKDLTFRERSDAILYRSNINQVRFRFQQAEEAFYHSHNLGYCAFEMQKHVTEMQEQLRLVNQILTELGKIEHYNYEAVLAQAEEEVG